MSELKKSNFITIFDDLKKLFNFNVNNLNHDSIFFLNDSYFLIRCRDINFKESYIKYV